MNPRTTALLVGLTLRAGAGAAGGTFALYRLGANAFRPPATLVALAAFTLQPAP